MSSTYRRVFLAWESIQTKSCTGWERRLVALGFLCSLNYAVSRLACCRWYAQQQGLSSVKSQSHPSDSASCSWCLISHWLEMKNSVHAHQHRHHAEFISEARCILCPNSSKIFMRTRLVFLLPFRDTIHFFVQSEELKVCIGSLHVEAFFFFFSSLSHMWKMDMCDMCLVSYRLKNPTIQLFSVCLTAGKNVECCGTAFKNSR